MTRRLELPKFQAFDANGDPLSGGKVYTYEAGTSTLKTSYSDYDASTANANPVVLDSRGEADIYVKGAYKISVYTSADVLVWTLDNVQGGVGGDSQGEEYYYPDSTAADQGATGNSDTIKYAVDTISTDRGTIYLRHNSGSATTTYTLTTSETIPKNVTLIKEPGAILDGAGTLTIEGQFEAGLNEAFGSSITVTFGDSYMDGVYPQWWEEDAGDGSTDCATAIQSAINACVGSAAGHYKCVYFVPGEYSIESKITMKTSGLVGIGGQLNTGVRILWNGSAGVTAFEKDSSHEGNNSFVRIENISFRGVANNPDYWLDFSTNTNAADAHFRLKELQFVGTAKSPIKLAYWLNCHLEHIRFDNFGEYCIDIKSVVSAGAMGSFVLDGFTIDSITQASLGMIHFDFDDKEISNWGPFELSNGRIEINTQMDATNPGIFVMDIPNATAYTRSVGLKLRNVSIQDSESSSVYILQRLTTNTTAGETLILENVRLDGIAGLVAGTPGTGFNNIPYTTGNIGYLALNVAGSIIPGNAFDMTLFAPYYSNDAIRMQNKDDTEARFTLDSNAYLNFGPGDGSVDTGLRRKSTPGSGIYGMRTYEAATNSGVEILNKTTEITGMSGATETWSNAIPAGVIDLGVTARVTTLITGATSFDVGIGGNANKYLDNVDVALGTTGDLSDATFSNPGLLTSADDIVVTANGSDFTAGAVRLTFHYIRLQAPSS